jgi:hypothetical protein
MWSLPDLERLNARAKENVPTLKREARRKEKPECEVYGCENRAVESVEYFDIFSNDPKGLLHVCEYHCAEDQGELFTCARCERLMVDHYTWERYGVELNGEFCCLVCAAKDYFSAPGNWINPRAVNSVVLEHGDRGLPPFDSETGVLNLASCPHVLGVKQPLPAGIKFFDNAEFDSLDGHQISGEKLLDVIHRLDQPFVPVLDAAYQFAVSIGIYVRAGKLCKRKEVV